MSDNAACDWSDVPLLLAVPDVQRVLRLGRNNVYDLIRTGAIPHIKIGSRLLVPKQELRKMLEPEQ